MKIAEVTIPMGDCFGWACKQHLENIAHNRPSTLVHAIAKHPWDGHQYPHAWIEDDDKVYDWQTMVAGASKYAKQGWPKDEFYGAFEPSQIRKYTGSQPGRMIAKHRHFGPWE